MTESVTFLPLIRPGTLRSAACWVWRKPSTRHKNRQRRRRSSPRKKLRRLAVWGATAAGALCLAVLSSRNEIGAQRVALMLQGGGPTQVAAQKFNPEAETRRLADAVRGLAADDDQIKTRLAAVETRRG